MNAVAWEEWSKKASEGEPTVIKTATKMNQWPIFCYPEFRLGYSEAIGAITSFRPEA